MSSLLSLFEVVISKAIEQKCLALFNRMQEQRYAIILNSQQELRLFFVEKQKK
jgi:hypothetical protein